MEVHRGAVFYADLSPVVGSEQGGVRPVLSVQNEIGNRHSPTVIAAAKMCIRDRVNGVRLGPEGALLGRLPHHLRVRPDKQRLAPAFQPVVVLSLIHILLFSVLVYELVGPTLTKLALTAAGEIIPEGRTNARMANKPEFPVSLD